MSDSEYEMETIEKPKNNKIIKKRVASEKQIEHLRKIQPKATEAKKRNREIAQTINSYEKAKQPRGNSQTELELSSMKSDLSKVVRYLSQQEQHKIEKRKQKQLQKESVDKETSRAYSYNDSDLFR